jgi:TolB-like protein
MSLPSEDVRRQLDRLLASSVFANAGRMSRFLRFVVERTLAGDGDRLKEYVIGIEVFDRDTGYDPRVDSIVRVEAARLRSKLAEYYAGEGRNDALILTLPKGGYSPLITLESRPPAVNGAAAAGDPPSIPMRQERTPRPGARRWWPLGAWLTAAAAAVAVIAWTMSPAPNPTLRLAVLPFAPDTNDADAMTLARRLTEGVTAELVRAGRFEVVASSAARAAHAPTRRPRETAAALGADVLIEARVTSTGEHVRVEARAVGGALENKLWVESFDGTAADGDALERAVAGGIAAAIAAGKIGAAQ